MVAYEGLSELERYIANEPKPSFKGFVQGNRDQLPKWSMGIRNHHHTVLYGTWEERFTTCYKNHHKNNRSPPSHKCNSIMWSEIADETKNLVKFQRTIKNQAIKAVTTATPTAVQEALGAIGAQESSESSSSGGHREQDALDISAQSATKPSRDSLKGKEKEIANVDVEEAAQTSEDTVLNLFNLGIKKLNNKIDLNDKTLLQSHTSTQGATLDAQLKNRIIELILTDTLSCDKHDELKLLLTNVINLMDKSYCISQEQVSNDPNDYSAFDLDENCSQLLDSIMEISDEAELLARVLELRLLDIRSNSRNTDRYRMLCVISTVVDYLQMPPLDKDSSETTCYRRMGVILDYVFSGTSMRLKDGETMSESTKMSAEANHATHGAETASSSPKKIDLLFKYSDRNIEFGSSEWKSLKTKHLAKKQQSKNIRSNCSILSNLLILTNGRLNSIFAMDFLGDRGTLYKLRYHDGHYIASAHANLFLPSKFIHLKAFKSTLKSLFFYKNFLVAKSDMLERIMLAEELSFEDDDLTMTPPAVFLTPKNSRKRSISRVE